MKLEEVAKKLGARLDGPGDAEITGLAGIEDAVPGQLTFIANPKYVPAIRTTQASAVIVEEDFPPAHIPTLRAKNPRLVFAHALELFYTAPRYKPGIHKAAIVHPTAIIGKDAHIGPYAVIDQDVLIGDNAVILAHTCIYRGVRIGHNFFAHTHAVVREFCHIGDNVTLQNGAIVGADGFGFEKDERGRWYKLVQSGTTVIGNDVEIQAHACVDRAAVGDTRIGNGVKIDNLAQVGHGSIIGENTLLCAQVGLAGSTEVGNNSILAGQVGIVGHSRIGHGVIVTAQSGVPGDVEDGTIISGSPAFDHRQWLKAVAIFNKLPELARAVRQLTAARSKEKEKEPV